MKYNSRLSQFFLVAVFLSLFSAVVAAQQADRELLQTYVDLSERSASDRQNVFERLPNDQKAQLYRVNIALDLTNRRDLSREQQRVMLTAIARLDASRHTEPFEPSPYAVGIESDISKLFSPSKQATFQSIGSSDQDRLSSLKKILVINSYESERERRSYLINELTSDKRKFWLVKFALHLATEKFTADQHEMFLDGLDLMHSELMYAKPANKEFQLSLDSFSKKSFTVFLQEDAYRIFMSPGGAKVCKPIGEEGKFNKPPCNCIYAAACGIISTCGGRCQSGPSDCGFGGGSACEGVCGGI